MEFAAIRHLANRKYCYALEEGRFLFKIATKKDDMDNIVLHVQDKYLPVDIYDTRRQIIMTKVATDRFMDHYEAVVEMDVRCLRYFFELKDCNGETAYYGNNEFFDELIVDVDRMFNCTQKFKEEERFDIPEWARNSVVYQIFPARFATTQYVSEKQWYKAPIGGMDDLKGNLRGIINTLDHMVDLGVDVIYMTPVFKSNSMHKYDTLDYYEIDEHFGNKDDLKELVEACHKRGKKVILDGVFNHTSPKFFAFKDIMEKGRDSRYWDWYYIQGYPIDLGNMKRKPNFLSFSYFGGMPKLNLNNPETADYFVNVGKYWIEECDIDGWRLDVGDEITHTFMRRFRTEIKKIKKDAFIVGEDWQYGNDYLDGDEWDSIMNYSFYRLVNDFIVNEKITATRAMENLGYMRGYFNSKVYEVLWNLIDSHDTPRFLNRAGGNKDKQKLAAAMLLLLPGMPMVYYGDEYGMDGGRDPDCRRGMVWDDRYRDLDMYAWYKKLIALRHEVKAITQGVQTELVTEDTSGVIAITKELDGDKVTVVFHGKDGIAKIPEFKNNTDLISGKICDGTIGEYNVLIFRRTNQ